MKKRHRGNHLSPRQQRAHSLQRDALYGHLAAAAVNLELGGLERAEREARKALRIAPGDAEATLLLGGILFRTGRVDETLALLRDAVRRSPKEPVLLFDLALCAVRLGRLDEAESAIQKLETRIEREPASGRGRWSKLRRRSRKLLREIRNLRSHAASGAPPTSPDDAARALAPRPRTGPPASPPGQHRLFEDDREAGAVAGGDSRPASGMDGFDAGSRSTGRPLPEPIRPVPPVPPVTAGSPAATSGQAQDAPAASPSRPAAPPTCVVRFDDGSSSEPPWTIEPWSDDIEDRDLLLEAQRIRLVTQYEDLLCLPTLRGVERLEYQVETVRKILRRLNGRALLCDEVGLGKTIEAGMVIKEYLLRGLAQAVLVLVPPGLVRIARPALSPGRSRDRDPSFRG